VNELFQKASGDFSHKFPFFLYRSLKLLHNTATEIAYRHLQRMVEKVEVEERFEWVKNVLLGPEEVRKGVAALIVDFIASDESSPFYDRIRYTEWKEKTFGMMEPERVASLLIDYWSAIRDLYPSCFRQGITIEDYGKYT